MLTRPLFAYLLFTLSSRSLCRITPPSSRLVCQRGNRSHGCFHKRPTSRSSGICSVCFATRQLHLKDGTIHQHGPRNSICPGSNKPLVGSMPTPPHASMEHAAPPHATQASQSANQPYSDARSTLDQQVTFTAPTNISATPVIETPITTPITTVSHPNTHGPLIKHIPRSARPHIAAELVSVLNKVISDPDDPTNWSTLFSFGPVMLEAPPRSIRTATQIGIVTNETYRTFRHFQQ